MHDLGVRVQNGDVQAGQTLVVSDGQGVRDLLVVPLFSPVQRLLPQVVDVAVIRAALAPPKEGQQRGHILALAGGVQGRVAMAILHGQRRPQVQQSLGGSDLRRQDRDVEGRLEEAVAKVHLALQLQQAHQVRQTGHSLKHRQVQDSVTAK